MARLELKPNYGKERDNMDLSPGQQMMYFGAGGGALFILLFIILRISFNISRKKLIDKIMNTL